VIEARTKIDDRICQGDVIRDVEFVEAIQEHEGIIDISKVLFPQIIVLTQDCDLLWDHTFRYEDRQNQDKLLLSVLVAPLYNAEHVFSGEHLSELGISSQLINRKRTDGRLLMQNEKPRYHYLEFPPEISLVPSVIDFKHYFSAPVLYLHTLKKTNFICTVSELFREDISQRFASFLARIGLPEPAPPQKAKQQK
jgi:hypothetical protein